MIQAKGIESARKERERKRAGRKDNEMKIYNESADQTKRDETKKQQQKNHIKKISFFCRFQMFQIFIYESREKRI